MSRLFSFRFTNSNIFNILKTIYPKARALPVKRIFDRVGIDLVFGLPVTKDGYRGIIVFTEYLTSYAEAMPIKSKQMTEISKCFIKYISFFSPPKEILTDNGLEFVN